MRKEIIYILYQSIYQVCVMASEKNQFMLQRKFIQW